MNQVTAVSLTAFTIAAATSYLVYNIYRKTKSREIPTIWKQVGVLSDIFIYPIKSCRNYPVNEAECTKLGLKDGILRDRNLMVVDQSQNFITARTYPEMLKISVKADRDELLVSHESMDELRVNLKDVVKGKEVRGTVWGVSVPVYDCGDKAADWFSRLIFMSPSGLRLVYFGREQSTRKIQRTNTFLKYFTIEDTGAFPDETSYNLINLSSVEDLNSKLEASSEPVKPIQFRPNFFIKGVGPFEEDKWQFIKIGDNIFENVKACQRCIMTTSDPETGIRSKLGEPLKTLNTYRQYETSELRKRLGSSPRMGLQMALRSKPAKIKINDPVLVSY